MEEGGDLVRSKGGIVKVGATIASALTGNGICNFIFYNTMFGGFGGVDDRGLTEVGIVDLADGDIHVDAVKERAREFFVVSADLVFGASAFVGGVSKIAAGAGIHGGDEHEVSRVGGLGIGAGDGNLFVFQRLAKGFKDGASEFGDFIKKEDAEVGEGDFSGLGFVAAADNGDGGSSVVG